MCEISYGKHTELLRLWEYVSVSITNSSESEATIKTSLVLLVGLAAGFLSGMFGVGGGILIVPALVLVVKMDQRKAHGTSLAAVLPISAASLVTYWAHDHVDFRVALCLAIGAIGGAIIGTKLLHVLSHRTLSLAFSGLLIATAIRLFMQTNGVGRETLTVSMVIALVFVGLITGILAGLLGVGGGIVMVPAMMLLLGLPAALAKGTSVAVIIPTSIMGTYRNRSSSNANMRVALIVGFGGIVSAIAGGWISAKMSDTLSNVLFACLLIVVAVRLLAQVRSDAKQGIVH